MQTQSLTKSELVECLENVLELIKRDATVEGTISWTAHNSLGLHDVIALVRYNRPDGEEQLVVIGDVQS